MDENLFSQVSIFAQPWWLDTIAPGKWDAVSLVKNDKLVGWLPFVVNQRTFQGDWLTMPLLTQHLGPWIDSGSGKPVKIASRQKSLTTELIEKLPEFDLFSQNFHYSVSNWSPWYWKGFLQTTRYTYVLKDLSDMDQVWAGFDQKIRTDIRKAEKKVIVEESDDFARFLKLNKLVFQRQGESPKYSDDYVIAIDRACSERGCRKIFIARDDQGRDHAAVYIIWDKNSSYYLMGGGDPELRSSGATSLCMWKAINFASTVTRKFDFEGSMIEPVERFFRGFGATAMPYSSVRKVSRRARIFQMLKYCKGVLK